MWIPPNWDNKPQESELVLVSLEEECPCDGIMCGASTEPGDFYHAHIIVSGKKPTALPRFFPV